MMPSLFSDRKLPGLKGWGWVLYLVYAALLCSLFAGLGFPRPHVDDPFYVGTGAHLARTGELFNPTARNWMSVMTPGKHFVQFPLYPFLLAGWMKLAGISTASVLGFFMVSNFLCCLFAGWFVVRARLPWGLCLFLPWLILSISQTQGFRADLPGLCAFWIGAVCITWARPAGCFLAALFASAAILLWPVLLGFVVPLFALHLVLEWRRLPEERRSRWMLSRGLALAAGGGAVVLAFLIMIGFEWSAFFHDFFRMAAMRRPVGGSILDAFLGLSWARYDHAFLLSVLLSSLFILYWMFRPGLIPTALRLWIGATLAGCGLAIVLYAVNTQLIYFFFWMVFFAVVAGFVRNKAWRELGVITLVSLGLWGQLAYGVKGLLPVPRPETRAVTEVLARHPGATVVFDEVSYRYVFDLRTPPGAIDWICFHPAPALGAVIADKKPGQIWVVSEKRLFPDGQSSVDRIVVVE
jgi:hypothetical protein